MYGNRTICGIGRGDSAVRVINGKPATLGQLREAIARHPGARQLRGSVDVQRHSAALPVERPARGSPIWVAAYGPQGARPLTGEVGDGFILQLADPDIAEWIDRRGARPRPKPRAATRRRSSSAWPRPRTSPTARPAGSAHGRDQCRWFGGMVGNHVADIVARYGDRRRRAAGADRLHRRPRGLRLQRARHGRQHAHRLRARRDHRPVLPPR